MNADKILNLLRAAIARIEAGEAENAAWRIADAGGLLREQLDKTLPPGADLIGLHCPTGRGCVLPKTH